MMWAARKSRALLGPRGELVRAFRQVAKAIDWWYFGPGSYIHFMMGPHEYSDSKPFCCAGPRCHRCQQAVLARAAEVHATNREVNYGDVMRSGAIMYDSYSGPKLKTRNVLECDRGIERSVRFEGAAQR